MKNINDRIKIIIESYQKVVDAKGIFDMSRALVDYESCLRNQLNSAYNDGKIDGKLEEKEKRVFINNISKQ